MGEVDYMSKLTNRQREVFALVAQGLTQREIASKLCITQRTVKAHCADIRSRTDSRSTVEAAYKIAQSTQRS